MSESIPGYGGRILRVDLTNGKISYQDLDPASIRDYVGGTGLGVKILYDEVAPGVEWSDPDNRLILAAGPLGGTKVVGTGTISVVSKGPMTNLAVATQANGFLGAFLKFCGFDAIVVQGTSPKWVYLHVFEGGAELRDAKGLVGLDTWEMDDAVKAELDNKSMSVFGIGPAGENLVRFAAIAGDKGHVAGHNGVGAVMGSKKLKLVAVDRGKLAVPVSDKDKLSQASKDLFEDAKISGATVHKYGTAGVFPRLYGNGAVPVKNYTTNVFPEIDKFTGEYLRSHFETKPAPCWACRLAHCQTMKVTEGPYAGYEGDEPEYEGMAAWGPAIGQTDPGAAVMLSNLTDRLGVDVNESGWLVGWVMECYERGLLTAKELDGLEMTWGNAEGAKALMEKIARREGIGDLLAEGVMRASKKIGGEAGKAAIYTEKGATPRGHDHRAVWMEMLDTCVGGTSTIEATGGTMQPEQIGVAPLQDKFSPQEVSTLNARLNGRRQFEDCLGVCRFCANSLNFMLDAVNASNGWNLGIQDAMTIGRRIVNLLRVFNLRHGLDVSLEAPSERYGSAAVDGPAAGHAMAPHVQEMKRNYYKTMGWDPEGGKPLPETLKQVGLEGIAEEVWGKPEVARAHQAG